MAGFVEYNSSPTLEPYEKEVLYIMFLEPPKIQVLDLR